MLKDKKTKKLLKEFNFLKGYLMYLKYEDPLFKEHSKKFDIIKQELKEIGVRI